ncbi:MAG: hypothetical protein J6I96_01055 [Oscillospiraceae bacterium]|nr:hypothetical protein [Oscillospiraceae bacterium]
MELLFKKIELKTKIKLSVICAAAAAVWTVFTLADPMLSYALFANGAVGSNIMLIFLSLCVTIPLVLLFTVLAKADIPLIACTLFGLVYHISFIYVYSIFRYDIYEQDRRYLIIFPLAAGLALDIFAFVRVMGKGVRNVLTAAVFAALQAGAYLLLFSLALSAMLR